MLHYAIETTEEAKPALCELKMWEFKLEPSTYGKIRENANYPVTFPPNPLPKTLYIDEAFEIKYDLSDKNILFIQGLIIFTNTLLLGKFVNLIMGNSF